VTCMGRLPFLFLDLVLVVRLTSAQVACVVTLPLEGDGVRRSHRAHVVDDCA
jgi:hypothetical protein